MGLSIVAGVLIAFVVILVILIVGFITFTHWRARRLGRTPSYNPFSQPRSSYTGPQSAPGGLVGWVNNKIRAFKNRNSRVAGGAYEEPSSNNVRGRGSNRGFGPLDPDDAWDTRVGIEADSYGPGGIFEEQELGLHHGAETSYGRGGLTSHGLVSDYGEERGRSRSRDPKTYNHENHPRLNTEYGAGVESRGERPAVNPFDDDQAEQSNVSLRGVSPRPIDTSVTTNDEPTKRGDAAGSPTERRSIFKEDM